jgi:hypothetical protein
MCYSAMSSHRSVRSQKGGLPANPVRSQERVSAAQEVALFFALLLIPFALLLIQSV